VPWPGYRTKIRNPKIEIRNKSYGRRESDPDYFPQWRQGRKGRIAVTSFERAQFVISNEVRNLSQNPYRRLIFQTGNVVSLGEFRISNFDYFEF
jgi:hypothetical protein